MERINLSYEGADLRLSYELPYGLRVYGGGGGIFYKEPSTLKPWMIQYGMEYRSPWRIVFASIRPLAAVDIKNHEQNNWNADVSARAGIRWTGFNLSAAGFSSSLSIFVATLPPANFCGSASTIWELGRTTTFRMTHLNTIVKSCKHIVPQR